MAKLTSSSLEIVRQGNTGDKRPVITYHRGMGEELEDLGLNMVKHRRSPL